MSARELNENLPTVFTEEQVNFLLQRTPEKAIRQRKGRGGKMLTYITQQYVTRLLNKVFGFNWDFDVLWEQIGKREVIVKGRLTVRANDIEISKTQFGGAEIKRYKENGQPLSVADDLKAAASDALKKCASLLGIGLDLYDEGAAEEIEEVDYEVVGSGEGEPF
ncbi:MAG: Rad52/Rad22 family DNA repair protein [Candidatus Bipolaricaulia bacterium]